MTNKTGHINQDLLKQAERIKNVSKENAKRMKAKLVISNIKTTENQLQQQKHGHEFQQ